VLDQTAALPPSRTAGAPVRDTARHFARVSELSPAWLNRDMHLHTSYTDGRPTVTEVIRRAEEIGLEEIAFTEHMRSDSDWFHAFADDVRAAAAGTAVRVLVGAEVRITDFDGSLDITPELRRECDVVLASVHRFPGPDGAPLDFARVPRDTFAETEFRLALGFLRRGGADVLAHPGGMSQRRIGGFPDEMYRTLVRASVAAGVAIEISVAYLRDVGAFLALLRDDDPLVSIGSDAHTLDELGRCRDALREYLWPAQPSS
jgi:putative hydrolase